MRIDHTICVSCQSCVPYCTMGAIRVQDGKVDIDFDECVECGVCLKLKVCPMKAIYQNELTYPRVIRSTFSNPEKPHERTKRHGRGTEEMKTNDVTNRYVLGELGLCVEVGRPGVGARMRDVEKIIMALADGGVEIEENNPLFDVIADPKTGSFKPEVLNEKVMSAIIELKAKPEKVAELLDKLSVIQSEIDTVFSVSVIARADENGDFPDYETLNGYGYYSTGSTKVNIGLGRVTDMQEVRS